MNLKKAESACNSPEAQEHASEAPREQLKSFVCWEYATVSKSRKAQTAKVKGSYIIVA